MTTTSWIIAMVLCIALGALVTWLVLRMRRSQHLRHQFGPEYDRTLKTMGGRSKAEAELAAREARVSRLQIRELSSAERDRFVTAWHAVQESFVDAPGSAIDRADDLVGDLMQARGYPVSDFEQRAADISVDYPKVVSSYRAAHRVAEDNDRGQAGTEDLRRAMIAYRELFEELLGTETVKSEVRR